MAAKIQIELRVDREAEFATDKAAMMREFAAALQACLVPIKEALRGHTTNKTTATIGRVTAIVKAKL